jgi:hypothetical protein
MPPVLPEDPVAFVAQAEAATNAADVEWAMSIYAPSIKLETFGDGVRQVHEGAEAVRSAVTTLYDWLSASDGHIHKTLVAASGDVLVNEWQGNLFNGRYKTYGAEFWYFDDTGHVVRNVLYQSLDPKPLLHPITGVRGIVGHPRVTLAYLAAWSRGRRRNRGRGRASYFDLKKSPRT